MWNDEDWIGQNVYHLDLSILTREEIIELWKLSEEISVHWGHVAWFKRGHIVFAQFPFYQDLELKIKLFHIVKEVEARVNEKSTYGQDEDSRMIQKVSYFDDFDL